MQGTFLRLNSFYYFISGCVGEKLRTSRKKPTEDTHFIVKICRYAGEVLHIPLGKILEVQCGHHHVFSTVPDRGQLSILQFEELSYTSALSSQGRPSVSSDFLVPSYILGATLTVFGRALSRSTILIRKRTGVFLLVISVL